MRAVLGVSPERADWQFRECDPRRDKLRRCCGQYDDRRQFVGMPEDSDLVSAPIRVRQEIVTPSTGRDLLPHHRRRLESPCRGAGTQGCGAGTPRQGLRVPFQRHSHRRPLTANHPSTWPGSFDATANLLYCIRKLYRFANVYRAPIQHRIMPKPDWPFPVLSPLATTAMYEADHDSLARSASGHVPDECREFAAPDQAPAPDRGQVRHAQPLPMARPRMPHRAAEDRSSCAFGRNQSLLPLSARFRRWAGRAATTWAARGS